MSGRTLRSAVGKDQKSAQNSPFTSTPRATQDPHQTQTFSLASLDSAAHTATPHPARLASLGPQQPLVPGRSRLAAAAEETSSQLTRFASTLSPAPASPHLPLDSGHQPSVRHSAILQTPGAQAMQQRPSPAPPPHSSNLGQDEPLFEDGAALLQHSIVSAVSATHLQTGTSPSPPAKNDLHTLRGVSNVISELLTSDRPLAAEQRTALHLLQQLRDTYQQLSRQLPASPRFHTNPHPGHSTPQDALLQHAQASASQQQQRYRALYDAEVNRLQDEHQQRIAQAQAAHLQQLSRRELHTSPSPSAADTQLLADVLALEQSLAAGHSSTAPRADVPTAAHESLRLHLADASAAAHESLRLQQQKRSHSPARPSQQAQPELPSSTSQILEDARRMREYVANAKRHAPTSAAAPVLVSSESPARQPELRSALMQVQHAIERTRHLQTAPLAALQTAPLAALQATPLAASLQPVSSASSVKTANPVRQRLVANPTATPLAAPRPSVRTTQLASGGLVGAQAQERLARARQEARLSSLHKANAQDDAIIKDAQRRIAQRSQTPDVKVRFKQEPTHHSEKRLAVLSGDLELVRHGSFTTKPESTLSEDEVEDVLKELRPSIAQQKLFNRNTRTRSADGYVLSSFVADSSASEAVDDDPTSDHHPSTSPSASASPSRGVMIPRDEWERYQAFLHSGPASSAPEPPQPPHGTVDQHGRQAPSFNYNIVVAEPPEHGAWNDVQHLMGTFKDKHERYISRCGAGAHHQSVWECYKPSAKASIIKHLETPVDKSRNAEFLASLTNDELYDLLQNELGITYPTEVELELNKIPFLGSVLEKPSWVNFHTAWEDVLMRVTQAGQVEPKRMAQLFRDNIPDAFIREFLQGKRSHTWQASYDAIIQALDDPKWLVCYNKDAASRKTYLQQSNRPARQLPPAPVGSAATPAGGSATAPAAAPAPARQPFDPLTWKNRRGQVNVNPHMRLDVNHNTSNTPCSRCDELHRFKDELCTSTMTKGKQPITPALTPEEQRARLQKRWDLGFFFAKVITAYKSPSAGDAAAASQNAANRIQGTKL